MASLSAARTGVVISAGKMTRAVKVRSTRQVYDRKLNKVSGASNHSTSIEIDRAASIACMVSSLFGCRAFLSSACRAAIGGCRLVCPLTSTGLVLQSILQP